MMVLTAFMISSMRDWIELARFIGFRLCFLGRLAFFLFLLCASDRGVEVAYERGVAEMFGEKGVSGAGGVKHGVNWSKIYRGWCEG